MVSKDILSVVDSDGDAIVELVVFPTLKILRNGSEFNFEDISDTVRPEHGHRRGVVAIVEVDFDVSESAEVLKGS